MKKILVLIFFLFSYNNLFATDACDNFLPKEVNLTGKIIKVVNLRSFPCTYKSEILGVSKVGEQFSITSKVDGWYEINTIGGEKLWIWDKAIEIVPNNELKNVNFNNENNNSNIVLNNKYELTLKDNVIINKLIYQIDKIIKIKGEEFKNLLILKIDNILNKSEITPRLSSILNELKNRILNLGKQIELNNSTNNNYLKNYNIDSKKISLTWLSWYNTERNKLGKESYSYSDILEKSAILWSNISKDRGYIDHKRKTEDSYYNYSKINNWFKQNGVICENIYRVTHSENIGYGVFNCNDNDCSDELIGAIKSNFNNYMSEKNKTNRDHYESIMNDYFTQIGVGISIDNISQNKYKYYLTVHYCTNLI